VCVLPIIARVNLPWLTSNREGRIALNTAGRNIHFWPFDGWDIPPGRSAIVEAYPSLYKHDFPMADKTPDQHDAYAIAVWMLQADLNGQLSKYLNPNLSPQERGIAGVEGWILGVG